MDDFALDYYTDPRNAGFAPPRGYGVSPFFTPAMQAAPPRPPIAQPAQPGKGLVRFQPMPVQTMPALGYYAPPGYGYPPAGYGYPPAAGNVPMRRRLLRDLTIGDLLPLLALGITALRTLPEAPTDERDVAVNVVNQTKFMSAVARHFQTDARLNAAGTIAGSLIG